MEYNFENSLIQAKLLDYANLQNKFTGNLSGVPIAIKDIFNTSDYSTQMGSRSWEGFRPGNDARCVNKLRLEGSLVLGKTVTAEFAIDYPGLTKTPMILLDLPNIFKWFCSSCCYQNGANIFGFTDGWLDY